MSIESQLQRLNAILLAPIIKFEGQRLIGILLAGEWVPTLILEETTLKVDYAVESDDSSGNVASITSKLEEVSAGNGAAKSELATSLGDAVGDATGTTVAFTVDGVVSVDVVATAAPTSSTEAEIPRPPPLPSTEVEESSAPLALAAALILTETSA